MESVDVKRTIVVKAIVTEDLKQRMMESIKQALNRLDLELQQMEFQGKRTIADVEKQNVKQAAALRQQLDIERDKKLEAKRRLQSQEEEILAWSLGDEVVQGTIEGNVTLSVGDEIQKALSAEIVVKDGVVVEIRA